MKGSRKSSSALAKKVILLVGLVLMIVTVTAAGIMIISINKHLMNKGEKVQVPTVENEKKAFENQSKKDEKSRNSNQTDKQKVYSNSKASFTFRYPDNWEIINDYFYHTAAGVAAEDPTVILQKKGDRNPENWIMINSRQFNCEKGKCATVANQITVGTYSKDKEVLSVLDEVVKSFSVKSEDFLTSADFITDYKIEPETKVKIEMISPKVMERNKENEVRVTISNVSTQVGVNLYQSSFSVMNVARYRLSTEENVRCKEFQCSIFITPLCDWPDSITIHPTVALYKFAPGKDSRIDYDGPSFNIILRNQNSEVCGNEIDDDCNGQIDGADSKCSVFTIRVLPGEGITNIARRAVNQYLKKFYDDSYLNKEQKIYAEDYIKRNLKDKIGALSPGEKIEISGELVKEAVDRSKELSATEINSISKYKKLINYSGYRLVSKSESVMDVDALWKIDDHTKEQLVKLGRFQDDNDEAWKVVDGKGSIVVYYQNENIDRVYYLIGAYKENVRSSGIIESLLIHSVEVSDDGLNWRKVNVVYNNFYDRDSSSSGGDGTGTGSFYINVGNYNKGSLYIKFNLKSYLSATGITLTKNLKARLNNTSSKLEEEVGQVIYPNKSSVLELGKTYQIQWQPNDVNRLVGISLNDNRIPYSEEALVWSSQESIPDTGSYSFTVPMNLDPGDKYQFVIVQYYPNKVGTNILVSEEFSIVAEKSGADCSSVPDGICPKWCAPGSDYDCCIEKGYKWIEGRGCY